MLCQSGFHDKVEVVPHNGRLPLYWSDPKAQQKIQFKFALSDDQGGFDESAYEWSHSIKPRQIGRISIRCRSSKNPDKHVVVIKQVYQQTATVFIIFRIEDSLKPTYQVANLTQSVSVDYK